MEQVTGFEPTSPVWRTGILTKLNYTCIYGAPSQTRTGNLEFTRLLRYQLRQRCIKKEVKETTFLIYLLIQPSYYYTRRGQLNTNKQILNVTFIFHENLSFSHYSNKKFFNKLLVADCVLLQKYFGDIKWDFKS